MDGQALYKWGQEKVEEGAFDEWCWINVLYPEPWMIDDYDDIDYNEVAEKGHFVPASIPTFSKMMCTARM